MIANFRVQAELSAVESTEDGRAVVLGTVDGCLSVLAIADVNKPEMVQFLTALPSRNKTVSNNPDFINFLSAREFFFSLCRLTG